MSPDCYAIWSLRSDWTKCLALLGPVQRQVVEQPIEREFRGLTALKDRLDEVRGEKGAAEDVSHVAVGHVVFEGDRVQGFGLTGQELLIPDMSSSNRLDECHVG